MATASKPARVDTLEPTFSRLEASLVKAEVAPRPNSVEMKDVWRHAKPVDVVVNELDFNYDLNTDHYPLQNLNSLQQVFDAVQYQQHLSKAENFAPETAIECLDATSSVREWRNLDDAAFRKFIRSLATTEPTLEAEDGAASVCVNSPLLPLIPAPNTSFGSRIPMTPFAVKELFRTLKIHPLFLLNLLGRPDYWAPQTYWQTNEEGDLIACDFFCQHPRWNLQKQGAPLSVYMRFDAVRDMTAYIISHSIGDTSIETLKSIINIAIQRTVTDDRSDLFLNEPFDIHTILSTLSFESSKFQVKKFQRFMWTQVNKVDDHLGGLEASDRSKLRDLTKQLQIMSQNADSHIANAEVAIMTAGGIRDAQAKLHTILPGKVYNFQRAVDSIEYVIKSLEKQKMWFLNYKNRKDSTMVLVYNLVTQEDAANNIEISNEMKRDSTSMNAIAALTMVFLPGTFTATVLGAGIFTAIAGSNDIHVSGIWWLWIVTTIPITTLVMLSWWYYQHVKSKKGKAASQTRKDSASSSTDHSEKHNGFSSLLGKAKTRASIQPLLRLRRRGSEKNITSTNGNGV